MAAKVAELGAVGGVKVLSLFSGTEIQDLCGQATFAHFGHGGAYETIAACECKGAKQNFIKHIVDAGRCDKCIFAWASSLVSDDGAAPVAYCMAHMQNCRVPRGASLLTGGWSCKNLSKASVSYPQGQHNSCLRNGTGTSGSAFHDLLHVLGAFTEVKMYIGENVDDVLRVKSDNRLAIVELFTARGWQLRLFELEAADYGLPQKRKRAWLIAIHPCRASVAMNEVSEVLAKVERTLRSLVLPATSALPLSDFFLPASDPYIKAQLEEAQQAYERRLQNAAAAGMGTSAAGSASAAAGGGKDHKSQSPWQETLLDLLRESGFSWSDLVLPDDMQENVTVKAMPERSRTLGGVRGRICEEGVGWVGSGRSMGAQYRVKSRQAGPLQRRPTCPLAPLRITLV